MTRPRGLRPRHGRAPGGDARDPERGRLRAEVHLHLDPRGVAVSRALHRRRMDRDAAVREIARAFLTRAGMTVPGELARVTGLSRSEAGLGNRALVAEGFATMPARGVYVLEPPRTPGLKLRVIAFMRSPPVPCPCRHPPRHPRRLDPARQRARAVEPSPRSADGSSPQTMGHEGAAGSIGQEREAEEAPRELSLRWPAAGPGGRRHRRRIRLLLDAARQAVGPTGRVSRPTSSPRCSR